MKENNKTIEEILVFPSIENALKYIKIIEHLYLMVDLVLDNTDFSSGGNYDHTELVLGYEEEILVLENYFQEQMSPEQSTQNMDEFRNIYRVLEKVKNLNRTMKK